MCARNYSSGDKDLWIPLTNPQIQKLDKQQLQEEMVRLQAREIPLGNSDQKLNSVKEGGAGSAGGEDDERTALVDQVKRAVVERVAQLDRTSLAAILKKINWDDKGKISDLRVRVATWIHSPETELWNKRGKGVPWTPTEVETLKKAVAALSGGSGGGDGDHSNDGQGEIFFFFFFFFPLQNRLATPNLSFFFLFFLFNRKSGGARLLEPSSKRGLHARQGAV